MRKEIQLFFVMLLLGFVCRGEARECYVVTSSGEKVRGFELVVDAGGTLKLKLGPDGPTQSFKPGRYRYGYVPRPKAVAGLEKAYSSGQFDMIRKYGPDVFEKYKLLGWGDHIAYLRGMVLVDEGKYSQAYELLKTAQRYIVHHGGELRKALVLVLTGLERFDEAKSLLRKMTATAEGPDAAFAFNTKARILSKEGKRKEAVLEYLKVLLLFEPGPADRERDEARKEAVELLKNMKDPRWQEIGSLE